MQQLRLQTDRVPEPVDPTNQEALGHAGASVHYVVGGVGRQVDELEGGATTAHLLHFAR